MRLNLDRGLFRLSLVVSGAMLLVGALLEAEHWRQRQAAWRSATAQPTGRPVVLLSSGGFVTLPADTDPKQALASILGSHTLPDPAQVMEWKPGCVSLGGNVPNAPWLIDDTAQPAPVAPKSESKAQAAPRPAEDRWWEDSPLVTDWQDICLYHPVTEVRPMAGYLEDGGRLYSRLEVLSAEAGSGLSSDAVRSLEGARSSGAFPRAATEPSWRDVLKAIGLSVAFGVVPLALFGILRWVLRGFAGG